MNWGIVGHDWAVALLQKSLAVGRVAHAYLFSGPPQIGKTRLALALAQALNCGQPDAPCRKCASCRRIELGTHPDVRVIEGAGVGGNIKIDQVRALQREAVLSPYEASHRVYVLRRMDLATLEAANSLLKTLEEPPAHVVLILTALQAELLPETVVSRCQRIDLRPVPRPLVEQTLRNRGVSASQALLLARLSDGRVGWALDASEDQMVLRQRQQDLDQLIDLLTEGRVGRFDFAAKAGRDADASRELLELWTSWWRDLLLVLGQGEDHLVNVDRSDELRQRAEQTTMSEVRGVLVALQEALRQLDARVNPRLALEGLLLQFPRWRPVAAGATSKNVS